MYFLKDTMNLITIHPGIYLLYYFVLVIFTLLFNDIYYLLSFLFFILILLYFQGASSEIKNILIYFVPMALIIIVLNPLFSHAGTTKMILFSNYVITLESLFQGVSMAFSLLIILLLFLSFNKYLDHQKLLYLFSNSFPNISMIVIMTIRFVTLLNYRLEEINKLFNITHDNQNESKIDKIRKKGHLFGIVTAFALEESMLTSKSMKARGYGISKRTNYSRYVINEIDLKLIILIILTTATCLLGLSQGFGNVEVYPTLSSSFFKFPFNIFYLTFLILLSPFICLELREKMIWKYGRGELWI